MIKSFKSKSLIILLITCMVISLTPVNSSAVSEFDLDEKSYDGYIFKLKDGKEQDLDAQELVDNEIYAADSIKEINELVPKSDIEYIEPNYIRYLSDYSVTPNDKYFEEQKWIFDTLSIPEVWKNGFFGKYNDKSPVVAVIDTGVTKHPDLKNVLPGVRYLDGKKIKYNGDIERHGTFIAGIISAVNNNEIGISGVMPDTSIYPIAVFDKDNKGEIYSKDSDLILGIEDAIENGVDVINLSLGSFNESQAEKDAINKAVNKGIIVVAASGNKGNSSYFYPASYDNVVSVAAITSDLKRAKFSNYNKKVDVAAPGKDIISTMPIEYSKDGNTKYGYMRGSGTSFATAYVSGLAAMFKAINPEATTADFDDIIKRSSTDIGAKGYDSSFGYGVVNFMNVYYSSLNLTNLPKPRISKLSKKKKAISVSWNKLNDEQRDEIDGYQLAYSRYHSFKVQKKIEITDKESGKYTIKKLKSKKKYYIKIRTFKDNYYSRWSGIRSIKTK